MLHAHTALADITPPHGLELSGGAFGPAKGVLHPLHARALYLENGAARLLLFSCDLLGFPESYAAELRRAITQATGVPAAAVMLTATHTHCGPGLVPLRYWGRPDEAYREWLRRRLLELAREAVSATRPAQAGSGVARCPGAAVNRALKEAGPVNDRVTILRLDDDAGRPLAAVVNFACHPVNLHSSGLITPDFPHFVERDLRAALGPNLPVFYLSGAGGDLNPANFGTGPSEALAEQTGAAVSRAALDVWRSIRTDADAPLACATRTLDVPYQPLPSREELHATIAERREKLERETDRAPTNWAAGAHLSTIEWATEALAALDSGAPLTSTRMELQAFRIGDFGLAGVPGELFTEFGIQVAESGVFPRACVATLANGCNGYFPSRLAYERKTYEAAGCPKFLGIYFFQPGIGERMGAECVELLKTLAAGR